MYSAEQQFKKANNLPTNQQETLKELEQNQQGTLKDILSCSKGNNSYLTQNQQNNIIFFEANQQQDRIKNPENYQLSNTISLETNQQGDIKHLEYNQQNTLQMIPSCQQEFKAIEQGNIKDIETSQQRKEKDIISYQFSNKEGFEQINLKDLEQNESSHIKIHKAIQQINLCDLALKISDHTQRCFSMLVIQEIILLLQDQQPEYQNFKYLGHSEFSLVLQASKNEQENVALKIAANIPTPEIELTNQEKIIKLGSESEYFVKVRQIFFLCEQCEEQKKLQNSKYDANYRYQVIEMELCQSNLRNYLQHLKDQKIILSDIQKEMMAMQIVDSINLLHSKNIIHRNIKPENFLISYNQQGIIPVILKLSDLEQASRILEKNSKSSFSGKKVISSYMSEESFNDKFRKESDLFSLGIILIELDNYYDIDYTKLSIIEFLRKEGIAAFKSHNLNEKSLIFEVSKILLEPKYQKRLSAKEILARFFTQKGCQNVPLFSVVTQNKTSSFVINSRKEINISKKLKNMKIPPQLSIDQIRKAVDILYKKQKFSLFSVLGQGSQGVVFSAINMLYNRESALKISLVLNRLSILRQIEVMIKCRSPYIVNFLSYEFFNDENNTEYVAFEFEKCDCTLTYYLDHQTQEEQYPQETKERMALQIIDSIALLHRQNVLHGNIKLENFLISEDEEGKVVVKLAGFKQSGVLKPDYHFNESSDKEELIENSNCLYLEGGSLEYLSPEKYHTPKNPTTKLSDGFSAGICLLLLENYLNFSNQFCQNHFQLLRAYEKPYKKCTHLFNLESQVYKWALLLLAFHPQKRLFPNEIVDQIVNSPTPLYSKWNNKFPLKNENQNATCLFLKLQLQGTTKMLENEFTSISTQISLLKLYLERNDLTSFGVGNLLKSISRLISLSSLDINLSINQITKEGEEHMFQDLSALTSLCSLKVYLCNNKFTSIGVAYLLKSISSLSSLSFLEIYLTSNQLEIKGESDIPQDLSSLTSLYSLKLDLSYNKLACIGVGHLFKGLSKLSTLSSLEINLYNNQIRQKVVNIFSDLSSLTLLCSLKLNLCYNKFTSVEVGNLFKTLSKLSSLQTLEIFLSFNQIGKEGEGNIFLDLSSLNSLCSLNLFLQQNQLTSIGGENLFKSISKITSLQSLEINLYDNQIGYQSEANILQDLSALTSLSSLKLDLEKNKLSNIGIGNILKSISRLSTLQSLVINLQDNEDKQKERIERYFYSKFNFLTSKILDL